MAKAPARPNEEAFVRVALPVPLRRTFTYRIAPPAPPPGTRVRVPFGPRTLEGWIVGPGAPVDGVRDVRSVVTGGMVLTGELMRLASWIAEYYVTPLGVVLEAMLPGAGRGRPKRRKVVRATREIGTLGEADELFHRAPRQREAFQRVVQAGGSLALAALTEGGFTRGVITSLEGKGLVAVEWATELRDPFADEPPPRGPPLTPTHDQQAVLARLEAALDGARGALLLHGVTGSGKTLVYIEFIRRVLDRGKGAIVLVPEIALTPQTVSRFRAAFKDEVAVLHSGLSPGERRDAWQQLRAGGRRIAVGARSAVFAPIPDLGAVVVDEEHDGSYKQSRAPRYHGRDVAVARAARAGAVCVLGSATPSLESWANAKSGKYELVELPERVGGGVLPRVRVVDLRAGGQVGRRDGLAAAGSAEGAGPVPRPGRKKAVRAAGSGKAPPPPPEQVISPTLLKLLTGTLERREQAIVLLNRRGYASFALCRSCGHVVECDHCSVALTLHRARRQMVCHHCGHTREPPARCVECGAREMSFRGLGTEQVESILGESLPRARIVRMDVDTTGGKWSHRDILERVRSGAADILLGTQMIAKGLDFPRVTLVGVVNADIGLHLPDFRASERTFQLLAQVAGRAGRASLPGQVVIQSYTPDHEAVRAAVAHDYRGFAERELAGRADPPYPPHLRLARILLAASTQSAAMGAAQDLGRWLRGRARRAAGRPEVLGPAPAPIERLQGRYRWHVLLRGGARALGHVLTEVADDFRPKGGGTRVVIDRDPLDLM